MPKMVERVAQALARSLQVDWSQLDFREQTLDFREQARAAIAAMREPTEAMVNACGLDDYHHSHDQIRSDWEAMIDEALRDA